MSIESIGGKLFAEETYSLEDVGGGVISKGQVVRHYEAKHPEHRVMEALAFKVDHETESVKIRVRVVLKTLEKHVFLPEENQKPVGQDQKLLNPGYDELLKKYNALRTAVDETELFKPCPHCVELVKVKEELVKQHEITDGLTQVCEKRALEITRLTLAQQDIDIDPGPEHEPELADGPADCDSHCEDCTSGACDVDDVDDVADLADAKEAMNANTYRDEVLADPVEIEGSVTSEDETTIT